MPELKPNQKEFVRQMTLDDEAADHGFARLAAHVRGHDFIDSLQLAGLFTPSVVTPATATAASTGGRLRSWRALEYLLAMANFSHIAGDLSLAEKVSRLTLAISHVVARRPEQVHDYYSQAKFVEILSALPESAMTNALIEEIPAWIGGGDGGQVLHAVSGRLIPRLLAARDTRLQENVLRVMEICTAITWRGKGGVDEGEPTTALDSYWVEELVKHHAVAAGRLLGVPLRNLWRQRVREVFSRGVRRTASWPYRPAIETHAQNMEWRYAENIFVEALRDGLLAAVSLTPNEAVVAEILSMYTDGEPIERRIAIHVINEEFDTLGSHFLPLIDSRLFDDNCLHETYQFLARRFVSFAAITKSKIVDCICLPVAVPADSTEGLRALRMERTWLSSIEGKGDSRADQRFQALIAIPAVGPTLENPDFFNYMTSWSGPGPSTYSVDELVIFLRNGTLIAKLNEFHEEPSDWAGPTKRALVDALELAIRQSPDEFLANLSLFDTAARAYQYAVISAFHGLWNASNATQDQALHAFDWTDAWPKLLSWIAGLLTDEFWSESVEQQTGLTPTRDWIPGQISELIKSGTRSDEHAFAPTLLSTALAIIKSLLSALPGENDLPESDPMQVAINSARGRTLEALFNLGLRWCRTLGASISSHEVAWSSVGPVFDQELAAADGRHFEFNTLAANYCAHLHYMSATWFTENAAAILSPASEDSFRCAVAGLVYAPANKLVYEFLLSTGALDRALAMTDLAETPRARLMERLALAFLWEQERLDGPRMSALLLPERKEDLLVVLGFFWSIGNQELSVEATRSVVEFWRRVSDVALGVSAPDPLLLAAASKLILHLQELNDHDEARVVRLAPFANAAHSSYYFVRQLHRLVSTQPHAVARIALAYLEANGSEFDFEGRWLAVAKAIFDAGHFHEAQVISEIMRQQPGFDELYRAVRV